MALVPNFTTAESISSPDEITFEDTSTGSDGGLTSRRIYIQLDNNNWLTTAGESTTEAYETWAIGDTTTTLSLLNSSTSATVTIKWMTGSTVTYSKVKYQIWDLYDYLFGLELIQAQEATPGIIQDANYYSNFFQFITNIWMAENAISYGDDVYSSQQQLNKNQYMITNQNSFF